MPAKITALAASIVYSNQREGSFPVVISSNAAQSKARSVITKTINKISSSMLARWDDFRTVNWSEIVEHPELTLQQTQQLLAITA